MNEPKEEPKIRVSQEYSVTLPQNRNAYMVLITDWQKIKRMIRKMVPQQNWYQICASLSAGVALTTLVGFVLADNPTEHFKIVTGFVLLASCLFAIGLFALDAQQRKYVSESSSNVLEEMDELEKLYPDGSASGERDAGGTA